MREASHTRDLDGFHVGSFARTKVQAILARGIGLLTERTIRGQLITPLVRSNYLGAFVAARRLPAWWRRFAGYERWLHDGTCGGRIDDHWLIAHWPSSRPIVLAPMIKFSADIRSFAEMAEKLGDHLNRFMMLPAVVLLEDAEVDFCEIPLRESTRAELHYEGKK